MHADPALGRQGACLLAALCLHGLALTLLPMLPSGRSESAPPEEHVISARLITEAAPASAMPSAAPVVTSTVAPESPQSAPPPPKSAAPKPVAHNPAPATPPKTEAPVNKSAPAPLIASTAASPSFTAPSVTAPPATAASITTPTPSTSNTEATSSSTTSNNNSTSATGISAGSGTSTTASATRPAPSTESAARPDYAYNPKPEYPSVARQFGLTGRVLMRVLVEPDGMPREILIANSSGHEMLDAAALKSVRNWRFVPARRAGEAYASWVEFPVRFDLTN